MKNTTQILLVLLGIASVASVARAEKLECRPCFEYYDGWYSYVVFENGKVIRMSALYGEVEKCESQRASDPDCQEVK